jgi:transcriptional regulator with XRE-family HTH domain
VGVDRSYYGAIERGEYKASIATTDRIACGLDMKLSELTSAGAAVAAHMPEGSAAQRALALVRKRLAHDLSPGPHVARLVE